MVPTNTVGGGSGGREDPFLDGLQMDVVYVDGRVTKTAPGSTTSTTGNGESNGASATGGGGTSDASLPDPGPYAVTGYTGMRNGGGEE